MRNIKCESSSTLAAEIESVRSKICLEETEESWDTIAKGISHLVSLCNNGACDFPPELIAGLRSLSRPLTNSMNSERTRLSGTAIELIGAVATGLGSSFEPLLPLFLPTLLNLCTRANKVFTTRARSCILITIESTQLPSILPYLAESLGSKSVSLRLAAAESVLGCLNCFNPPDLEKESRARLVEEVIRATAKDASADVRKISKKVFEAYKTLMPSRVDGFVAPLTPVIRKYLDVQNHPSVPASGSSRALGSKSQAKSQLRTQLTVALNDVVVDRTKGHTRSASSSQLSTGAVAKKPTAKTKATDFPGHGTAKPNVISEEAPNPTVQAPPTSQPYVRVRANTLRGGVPPSAASRPVLASSSSHPVASQSSSQEPAPRPKSVIATRRDAPFAVPAVPVNRGPLRPERVKSQSELRVSASEKDKNNEGKSRVVGGARRVPIQPPVETPCTSQELDESELKSTKASRPTSRADNSGRNVPLKASTSSTKPPPFQPTASKGREPMSRVPSRTDTSRPTSAAARHPTSLLSSQSSSRSDAEPSQRNVTRARGVTNPTLSQLSRINAAKDARKASDNHSAKPMWGRAVSTNVGKVVTKPLTIRDKSKAVASSKPSTSRPKDAEKSKKVKPDAIPLPPSPNAQPTSVPLPPSPGLELVPDTEVPTDELKEDTPDTTVTVVQESGVSTPASADGGVTVSEEVPEVQQSQPRPSFPVISTPSQPTGTHNSVTKTPITALLSSIERGFLFTPSSPLSPPQSYLTLAPQAQDPNAPLNFFGSQNIQQGKAAIPNFMDDSPSQDTDAARSPFDAAFIPPLAKPAFTSEDLNRQVLVDVDMN